jgi:molybdopterin molybdotransferase
MEPTTTMSEIYPTLSVEQALERVLSTVPVLSAERLPILQCLGRVLAEDVIAPDDIPPHPNSAMDGYAVRAEDLVGSEPRLRVIGDVPAGHPWRGKRLGPGEALRIMTGAVVPAGADTVVQFEHTRTEGDWVVIQRVPPQGRNVRAAGEDVRRGEIVLRRGTALRPQEIGMLASLGHPTAMVHRAARVAILATGDEVWTIDGPLPPGKIRNINSYANAAQVIAAGGEPLVLEVARDREDSLAERLRRALELGADLILTSGGVSVGDFDLVKQALAAQGQIAFWWVNMKPGKPLAFGTLSGVPLLALPGNPVAAMLAFHLFGRAAVLKLMGHTDWDLPQTTARLAEPITRKDGRRHYLRVRLRPSADGLGAEGCLAELTGDQGSGILTSMVAADGLAVIPEDVESLPAGSPVSVLLLTNPPYRG